MNQKQVISLTNVKRFINTCRRGHINKVKSGTLRTDESNTLSYTMTLFILSLIDWGGIVTGSQIISSLVIFLLIPREYRIEENRTVLIVIVGKSERSQHQTHYSLYQCDTHYSPFLFIKIGL